MCLNYNLNPYLKNNITTKLDTFNENLIDFFEQFDNKCTELGNFFIKKYKYYFEQNTYTRARYNNDIPTTPLSPDEYEHVNIPIINQSQPQPVELVNKHIIDDKQSFLDENVWDILNDV